MIRFSAFCAALACAAALSTPTARAGTHDVVYPPLARGAYPVGCTNVAQDLQKIATVSGGGNPSDFWEGRDNNGQLRYISQVLLEPASTLQYNAPVPDEGIYPQFRGQTQNFVMIVCYPTTDDNRRPDYLLPDGSVSVPKMQRGVDRPLVRGFENCRPICIDPLPSQAQLAELGRRPMIVFSHGLGGSPLSADYLSFITDIAAEGYIVAAIFHGDSRFSRIRIQDLGQLVTLANNFDKFAEMELLRPVAIKTAIDYLFALPDWAAVIKADQIGGFGASMGGQAMVNILGSKLTVTLGGSCAQTVTDPRIKAAVGYVPYMGQTFLPSFCNDEQGAEAVTRPYLAIAGTTDTTAPIRVTQQAVDRFKGTRYLVELVDVPHQYLPSYRDDVFGWMMPFFAAYVQGDRTALARLNSTKGIAGGLSDNVRISFTVAPQVQGLYYNASESGHGISLSQVGNAVFLAWYLYDSTGKATWLVVPSTSWNADFSELSGDAYIPRGSFFNNYDASRFVAGAAVGRITLRMPANFYDTSGYALSYQSSSVTGSKSFQRFSFAPTGSVSPGGTVPDFTGMWWGGAAQNGWGVAITQDKGALFSAWYTYDATGQPVWYTFQGGGFFGAATDANPLQYVADVYRNVGAPVLGTNFDATRVKATKVGTATFTFNNSFDSIRMTYDVEGAKGVNTLSRFSF